MMGAEQKVAVITGASQGIGDKEYQERIRLRAYLLWEEDGRPQGRADEYWERARFLLGIEDNPTAGTMPPEAKHDVIDVI